MVARAAVHLLLGVAAAVGLSFTTAGPRLAEALPSIVELKLEPVTGREWGTQQFASLDKQAFGRLRVSATPPCIPGNEHCALAIKATVSPIWGHAGVGFFVLTAFALVFAFSHTPAATAYVAVRKLRISFRFEAGGNGAEDWDWDGLHCENRELVIDQDLFDFRTSGVPLPQIDELSIQSNQLAVLTPPVIVGQQRYSGHIVLASEDKPPFRVGYKFRATNAWAVDFAALKATRLQTPGDQPNLDYWQFTVSYPIEDLQIAASGFQHLRLASNTLPQAIVREAAGASWKIVEGGWDPKTTTLHLTNLDVGTVIRIRWFLG